jgi:hypothetical protein
LGGAKVDGCWKLIYSTISILGKKRTKLGLRDFISLGDFLQIIDVEEVSEGYLWKWNCHADVSVIMCSISICDVLLCSNPSDWPWVTT